MLNGRTGPIACRYCDLQEICRLCGIVAGGEESARQRTGSTRRTLQVGDRLFHTGDPAHSIFAVRRGMLKTVDIGQEGEEHIVAIHTPGDVLGMEAFGNRVYARDAVAMQPVSFCKLPLSLLSAQYVRARELGMALINLLSRLSVQPIASVRGSSRERVAGLILELSRRFEQRGLDGRSFSLGMTRQDMASLLDTRIETVSRTIQKMHRAKEIEVTGQQVTLLSLKPAV